MGPNQPPQSKEVMTDWVSDMGRHHTRTRVAFVGRSSVVELVGVGKACKYNPHVTTPFSRPWGLQSPVRSMPSIDSVVKDVCRCNGPRGRWTQIFEKKICLQNIQAGGLECGSTNARSKEAGAPRERFFQHHMSDGGAHQVEDDAGMHLGALCPTLRIDRCKAFSLDPRRDEWGWPVPWLRGFGVQSRANPDATG